MIMHKGGAKEQGLGTAFLAEPLGIRLHWLSAALKLTADRATPGVCGRSPARTMPQTALRSPTDT